MLHRGRLQGRSGFFGENPSTTDSVPSHLSEMINLSPSITCTRLQQKLRKVLIYRSQADLNFAALLAISTLALSWPPCPFASFLRGFAAPALGDSHLARRDQPAPEAQKFSRWSCDLPGSAVRLQRHALVLARLEKAAAP